MIDTLTTSKKLKGAGLKEEQADIFVQALTESQKHLATKADITDLRADMKILKSDMQGELKGINLRMDSLEGKMDTEFKGIKGRMNSMSWLIALCIGLNATALAGIMTGLIVLLNMKS